MVVCLPVHADTPTVGTLQVAAGKTWHINQEADDKARAQENGVVFGDGDGTVPLLSLGYACGGPWRSPKLNPSGAKVRLCPVCFS